MTESIFRMSQRLRQHKPKCENISHRIGGFNGNKLTT